MRQSNRNASSHERQPSKSNDSSSIIIENSVIDVPSTYIGWKGIFGFLCGIILVGLGSALMGITAGMSLAIHFHDEGIPTIAKLDARERDLGQKYRVTILDPYIVDSNTLIQPDRLELGRAITTSPTGSRTIMSVVHESRLDHPSGQDTSETLSESPGVVVLDQYLTPPKNLQFNPKVQPVLCKDGVTRGIDDWKALKAMIQEANAFSAEKFMKWNVYFASIPNEDSLVFDDESLYYEELIRITVCPRVVLKARKAGPIFINAEHLRLQCDDCVLDAGGGTSHLTFGPRARNVQIVGFTFRHSKESSVLFHCDGAEATFEDCKWRDNGSPKLPFGAVADVNSTSNVFFSSCYMRRPKSSAYMIRN